ncbi:hypothetical protein RHGRI_023358 [Rhododendron griersonianum]|uniref:Uncharacterized protein n=1 Tax=Rhododendron griersonianum TaxID=479676 RepID=A0AAV6J741_9ERIC|nr:hypothetical protein RHGRI_023358 [Rhododendron griersonianum]
MYSASPGEARFFTSLGLLLESLAQVSLSLSPSAAASSSEDKSEIGAGLWAFSVVGFPVGGLPIASGEDQSPVSRGRKSGNG